MVGIAAGVALLFASQVSSSSLQSSVSQLSHGIVGRATLQMIARDPHGFPESMLARVRRTPGVRVAAPLLESGANAVGPHGHASVELVGADESLSRLGGTLVRHTDLAPFGGIGAVVLPAPLAHTVGVTKFGEEVTLQLGGPLNTGATLRPATRKADRRIGGEPNRHRPALFRTGNGGLESTGEPHIGATRSRRASEGADRAHNARRGSHQRGVNEL